MAKMKELLVDLIEYEDEIIELLYRVRDALPTSFALFFDDDLSAFAIKNALLQFTLDKELVAITVAAIEADMVDFSIKEETTLKLKIPSYLTSIKEDDINT